MTYLERATWIRFGVWLLVGLAIYLLYGRHHSLLQRGVAANPEAELEPRTPSRSTGSFG